MGKYEEFREKYPVFVYRSYNINETAETVEIGYKFKIEGLAEFRPSWTFGKPAGMSVKGDLKFERLAFSLGMAEATGRLPVHRYSAWSAASLTMTRRSGGKSCGSWDWASCSS